MVLTMYSITRRKNPFANEDVRNSRVRSAASAISPYEKTLELLRKGMQHAFQGNLQEVGRSPPRRPRVEVGPMDLYISPEKRKSGMCVEDDCSMMQTACQYVLSPSEDTSLASSGVSERSAVSNLSRTFASPPRSSARKTFEELIESQYNGNIGSDVLEESISGAPWCDICAAVCASAACPQCKRQMCTFDSQTCDKCNSIVCSFCCTKDFSGKFDSLVCVACTSGEMHVEGCDVPAPVLPTQMSITSFFSPKR